MPSSPRIRICLPCRKPKKGEEWGDYYFGRSLRDAFHRLGVRAELAFLQRLRPFRRGWHPAPVRSLRATVDLVIRGKVPYPIVSRRPQFIWQISHPEALTEAEQRGARHIFSASLSNSRALAASDISASYLPQCTDTEIFHPRAPEEALSTKFLFVGNRRHRAPRPSVRLALNADLQLSVWGRGWNGKLPDGVWTAGTIDNSVLGRHYASAGVVLNDHHRSMRRRGIASNRVYDVLASGRPILTEEMPGLPEDLLPYLYLYRPSTFADQARAALEAPESQLSEAATHVAKHHSFDARAREILERMRGSKNDTFFSGA